MATISQTKFPDAPKGPTDNKPAFVKIMAWYQIGAKPLSEPILTQFTDA